MPEPQKFGCLLAALNIFKNLGGDSGQESPTVQLPYRGKDCLLSKAERSFFGVLEQAVDGKFRIFAKIRLADLLWIPGGTEKRQAHLNRIQSKHIDFVLCSCDFVRPLLAIELDDATHRRARRQDRDDFVEQALGAAGLPLLRVPARRTYHVGELQEAITGLVVPGKAAS